MAMVSEYVRYLTDDEKVSYFSKLMQLGFSLLDDDPFLVDSLESKEHFEKWSHSIETWPELEFGNVYMFLIDCPGYTHKDLKTYKSLPAYNLYANGCLHRLYICHSPTGHSVIMGRVNRSEDHSEETHRAWVGFNHEDDSIVCGHCTCMAGDSSSPICDHVVAIIFQVEAGVRVGYQPRDCQCCFQPVIEEQEEKLQGDIPLVAINSTLDNDQVVLVGAGEEENSKYFVTVSVDGEVAGQATCEDENSERSEDVARMPEDIKQEEETSAPATSQNLEETEDNDEDPFPDETVPASSPGESPMNTEDSGKDLNLAGTSAHSPNTTLLENHQDANSAVKTELLNEPDNNGHTRETFGSYIESQQKENSFNCVRVKEETEIPINPGQEKWVSENCLTSAEKINCKAVSDGHKCETFGSHIESQQKENSFNCVRVKEETEIPINPGQQKWVSENCLTSAEKINCKAVSNGHTCETFGSHIESQQKENSFNCLRLREETELPISPGQEKWVSENCLTSAEKINCKAVSDGHTCETFGSHIESQQKEYSFNCVRVKEETEIPISPGQEKWVSENCLISAEKINCKAVSDGHTCETFGSHIESQQKENSFNCVRVKEETEIPINPGQEKWVSENCLTSAEKINCNAVSDGHTCETFGSHVESQQKENSFNCLRLREETEIPISPGQEKWVSENCLTSAEKRRCKAVSVSLRRCDDILDKMNAGQNLATCCVCNTDLGSASNLKRHMKLHTGDKKFKGPECGKTLTDSRNLKYHVEKYTDGKCSKESPVKNSDVKPINRSTGRKSPICHVCGKKVSRVSSLNRHMRIHTGEKLFKCSECGMAFIESGKLRIHVQRYPDGKCKELPFKKPDTTPINRSAGCKPSMCHLCCKSLSSAGNLMRHMRIHTGEEPFKCSEYGKSFSESSSLRKHVKRYPDGKCKELSFKNSDTPNMTRSAGCKSYVCHLCYKSFSVPSKLRRHMRIHTGEKPFNCSECGRAFTENGHLKHHVNRYPDGKCREFFVEKSDVNLINISAGCKSSVCHLCGKRFGSFSNLRRHMRIHTGEKPFKCSECGRAFTESGTLKYHVNSYPNGKCKEVLVKKSQVKLSRKAGYKPPVCHVCGKSFSHLSNLRRHMKIHTGEKPFKCPDCGRAFTDANYLRSHVRRQKRKNKSCACKECGKLIYPRCGLGRHMEMHARDKLFSSKKVKNGLDDSSDRNDHVETLEKENGDELVVVKGDDILMTTNAAQKLSKCIVCDKSFGHASNLKLHMGLHTGEKSCRHDEYGNTFDEKASIDSISLRAHIETHRGEKRNGLSVINSDDAPMKTNAGKKFLCGDRSEILDRSDDLVRHMRIHTGKKSFEYTECEKALTNNGSWRVHICRHEAERPNKYNEDGCMLITSSQKSHTNVLTREEPFKCPDRGNTLADGSTLREHRDGKCNKLRVNKSDDTFLTEKAGKKLFMCHTCHKGFGRSNHLKRHMRIHTGEKPFKCTECGKAFNDSSTLRDHRLTHTDGNLPEYV